MIQSMALSMTLDLAFLQRLFCLPFRLGPLCSHATTNFLLLPPLGNFDFVLLPFSSLSFNVGRLLLWSCLLPHPPEDTGYFSVAHIWMSFFDGSSPLLGEEEECTHWTLGGFGVLLGTFPRNLPWTSVLLLLSVVPFLIFFCLGIPNGPFFLG